MRNALLRRRRDYGEEKPKKASQVVQTIASQILPYARKYEAYLSKIGGRRFKLFKPLIKVDANTLRIKWAGRKGPNETMAPQFGLDIKYKPSSDDYNVKPFYSPPWTLDLETGESSNPEAIWSRELRGIYFDQLGDPDLMFYRLKPMVKTASHSRIAKIPPITLHMQALGSDVIDLFWVMTVKSAEGTTSKNFRALARKANGIRKGIVREIRKQRIRAAVIGHPSIRKPGYYPPNMIEAARVQFNQVSERDKAKIEKLLKQLGFKSTPLPRTASKAATERRARTLTTKDVFEWLKDNQQILGRTISEHDADAVHGALIGEGLAKDNNRDFELVAAALASIREEMAWTGDSFKKTVRKMKASGSVSREANGVEFPEPRGLKGGDWEWWLEEVAPIVEKALSASGVKVKKFNPSDAFYRYIEASKGGRKFSIGLKDIQSPKAAKELLGFLRNFNKAVKAYESLEGQKDPFYSSIYDAVKVYFGGGQGKDIAYSVIADWIRQSGRKVWSSECSSSVAETLRLLRVACDVVKAGWEDLPPDVVEEIKDDITRALGGIPRRQKRHPKVQELQKDILRAINSL